MRITEGLIKYNRNICMTDIFDNAVDSLKMGISHYLLNTEHDTAEKHAILMIYHSIELFLKEKLAEIHPVLIYANLNKKITSDSRTVGLDDIITRYDNFKIELSNVDRNILHNLRKRRNTIEHHKYKKEKRDFNIIGKALKFIHEFLISHFDSSMEDILDEKQYAKVRETIFEYEELLKKALQEVEKHRPEGKEQLADPYWLVLCPDCYNETLVMASERGPFCFLCYEEKSVEQCNYCSQYVDQSELDEASRCDNCSAYYFNKD